MRPRWKVGTAIVGTETKGDAMDEMKETDRPYQIFCVLDGSETFGMGYTDKAMAESALADKNGRAVAMGIKARYVLKEMVEAAPHDVPPAEEKKDVPKEG